MKLRWGFLGLGAACAACCAPLLLPLLAGAGVVSAGALSGAVLFDLTLDQILCYGLPLAGLLALVIVWARHRARARPASCACGTVSPSHLRARGDRWGLSRVRSGPDAETDSSAPVGIGRLASARRGY